MVDAGLRDLIDGEETVASSRCRVDTAVYSGWRPSSIEADLFSEQEDVFHDIQGIKERLNINVELARPEHFVPALRGTSKRHIFIERIGRISFFHYDPYAQILSKIVRGFERDLDDARHFLESGMVDGEELRKLVGLIPESAYSKYPNLSRAAVQEAVESFLADRSCRPSTLASGLEDDAG